MSVGFISVPLHKLTERTLEEMLRLAWLGKRDPQVKQLAVEEMSKVGINNGRDKAQLALALALWITNNIRFFNDPVRTETLQAPQKTLELKYGDCDDFAILYAALLLCVGIEARFKVMGRMQAEHVFTEAQINGGWIAFDPASSPDDPPLESLQTYAIADFRNGEDN